MDSQLISVIMPCFNAQAFVEQAVRSVLEQSLEDQNVSIDTSRVDKLIELACNGAEWWKNSGFLRRQRIQNQFFPDGIEWVNELKAFRTQKINVYLKPIPMLVGNTENAHPPSADGRNTGGGMCYEFRTYQKHWELLTA